MLSDFLISNDVLGGYFMSEIKYENFKIGCITCK